MRRKVSLCSVLLPTALFVSLCKTGAGSVMFVGDLLLGSLQPCLERCDLSGFHHRIRDLVILSCALGEE